MVVCACCEKESVSVSVCELCAHGRVCASVLVLVLCFCVSVSQGVSVCVCVHLGLSEARACGSVCQSVSIGATCAVILCVIRGCAERCACCWCCARTFWATSLIGMQWHDGARAACSHQCLKGQHTGVEIAVARSDP